MSRWKYSTKLKVESNSGFLGEDSVQRRSPNVTLGVVKMRLN